MAFPAILLVQNLSIYLFPFVILAAWRLIGFPLKYRHFIQFFALFFAFAAVASVYNIPSGLWHSNLENALQVLPNYLYWALLIWLLVSVRPYLEITQISGAIFYGLILSVIYFFFLQRSGLTVLPIFKGLTQNAFAFILICFAPIAASYSRRKYGAAGGLAFAVLFSLAGFLSESRSSSVLVVLGILLVYLVERYRISVVFLIMVFTGPLVFFISQSDVAKRLVMSLNERTYELIYNSDETFKSDRSYLVRRAMIEKGLAIHERYPLTGIGLNNFANYTVKIPGNFEGAYLVKDKRGLNETSAHNSYIGMLAEGGLFLLLSFLAIITSAMAYFFISCAKMPSHDRPFFIGLLMMSIHLYFIMAIVNVFAWFLIGICCALMSKSKH